MSDEQKAYEEQQRRRAAFRARIGILQSGDPKERDRLRTIWQPVVDAWAEARRDRP